MNTQVMEYYICTADRRSISAAAAELFITPQGLNKALRKVEAEYGANLFYFEDGIFTLTATGKIVYQHFSSMLNVNKTLKDAINTEKSAENARHDEPITLLSAPIFTGTMVPRLISAIARTFPNTKIRVIEYSNRGKINLVELSGCKVFIFGATLFNLDLLCRKYFPQCERNILLSVNVDALISKKSSLAHLDVISSENFLNRDLVLCRHENFFLNTIDPSYSPSQIITRSDNRSACITALVQHPEAIGFTNLVQEAFVKSQHLIRKPIEPTIEMVYGYLYDKSSCKSNTAAVNGLLSAIEKEFARLRQYKKTTLQEEQK